MKILAKTGREDIAEVFIAELQPGKLVELVEAVQPPQPREQKWVLLISTMFGCPVKCKMCDAGGQYQGKLSRLEILEQIDYLVYRRYPDGSIPCQQFKIQLARMGEPALNAAVLDVLDILPFRYRAPGLMPSLSTIAPHGADAFFERLLEIKHQRYSGGAFQFQFSLHTTDAVLRDSLIPVKKWSFRQMAEYGERFYAPGDRKITLNFALAQGTPVDPEILLHYFDPARYLVKITPLNPTYRARENQLDSYVDIHGAPGEYPVVDALRLAGYQVIVSIGAVEESSIGSNCGQYIRRHLAAEEPLGEGYTYAVHEFADPDM